VPSFDYASITGEQIQQFFDGHTYVTNSTQMSDESKVDGSLAKVDGDAALVVPDEQPFGLSPPTINHPSSPIGVENLGVPPVEPVVAENSKRKLLAGSDFYRALDHEGAITGIHGTGEIVETIVQCPRAANQNNFLSNG
jgi:hypothetical protein